eukprot:2968077-Rhodomonas_salina.3
MSCQRARGVSWGVEIGCGARCVREIFVGGRQGVEAKGWKRRGGSEGVDGWKRRGGSEGVEARPRDAAT